MFGKPNESSVGEGWKTSNCCACPYVVYIYMPYAHNPESVRKILRTRLKKGNGCLGKLSIHMPDSLMMKKTAADSKAKGKKTGSSHGLLGK